MTLARHSSRVYMDAFDLDGTIKVLGDRIGDADGNQRAQDVYCGAHLALSLVRNHEELRDQSVFMALFDEQLASAGVIDRGKHAKGVITG